MTAGCIFPKKPAPLVDLKVQAATQYNRRGMVMNERPVLQPEINLEVPDRFSGAFGVNAWGNLDLTNDPGDAWLPSDQGGRFSEVDLRAQYSHPIQALQLTGGIVSYVLPNGPLFPHGPRGSTSEIFGKALYNAFEGEAYGFSPEIQIAYDIDEAHGVYVNGGISKEFVIPALENFTFNLKGLVGYSDDSHSSWAYGLGDAGFSDFLGSGTVTYWIFDNLTVTAGIAGSMIIDSELQDQFDALEIDDGNVWGIFGVGVGL